MSFVDYRNLSCRGMVAVNKHEVICSQLIGREAHARADSTAKRVSRMLHVLGV